MTTKQPTPSRDIGTARTLHFDDAAEALEIHFCEVGFTENGLLCEGPDRPQIGKCGSGGCGVGHEQGG